MAVVDFYFGRNVAGRAPVSDAEWGAFLAQHMALEFPAGFSAFDASGQWLAPDGHVVREPSKLVRVVAPASPDLAARVQAVVAFYKTQFHQESVGVVSSTSCASF